MEPQVLTETPNQPSDSSIEAPAQQNGAGDADSSPVLKRHRVTRPRRRWRGKLLLLAVFAVGACGAIFLPDLFPEETDEGTRLTHTIKRGDLTVSVTEQGTLESWDNVEIKCEVRGFSTVTSVVPAGTIVKKGQTLVTLDTKIIAEQYSLTKTNTSIAKATLARTMANVEKARISKNAYESGRYRLRMQTLQKELKERQRNLRLAKEMHARSRSLFREGFVTELEVEGNAFTVKRAELELKVTETSIEVLKKYTSKMEKVTLAGNLEANESKQSADEAGLAMEQKRKARAKMELDACIIKAKQDGLVIYPSAAAWKRTPDITEGANVRKDQVLLLMPNLKKMQVKVGIHESIIDRVRPKLKAIVTLPDRTIDAEITSVAFATRPAGWWTGNVVKYDTIIRVPEGKGLKPGMTAKVEVILAVHKDVLTIPVAAVVETEKGDFCWVKTPDGPKKRKLQLGDSNDVFIVVKAGLNEGDEVVLNPAKVIDEAKEDALKTQANDSGSENSASED